MLVVFLFSPWYYLDDDQGGKELCMNKKHEIIILALAIVVAMVAMPLGLARKGTAAPRQHGSVVHAKTVVHLGMARRAGNVTAASLPGFSPAMMKSLNNTDVVVSPATTHAPVSAQAALNAAMADGLSVGGAPLAIQLIDATGHDHPVHGLVWAVSIDPTSLTYGRGPMTSTANFQVDFVSATTGLWLQDIRGTSGSLPPLKAAP
jgi:hypothetical protein